MIARLAILVAVVAAGWFVAHRAAPWLALFLLRVAGLRPRASPILRRRIARFKSIRRGWWAFVILTTLFAVSLFLELLVNDKALLIVYDGRWSCPAVAEWAGKWVPLVRISSFQKASDFGMQGDGPVHYRRFAGWCRDPGRLRARIVLDRKKLERARAAFAKRPAPKKPKPPPRDAPPEDLDDYKQELADYQDRLQVWQVARDELDDDARAILRLETTHAAVASGRAWIVLPPYPYGPQERLLEEIPGRPPHKPSREHPLGTTDNGTDVLPQLAYGFRIAMVFALLVGSVGYAIGILVGGVMGYYGGWVDIAVQRVVEIWGSIPYLYTMMIVASIIKPGVLILALLLIVLRGWIGITFTVRGEFYREKARDYVSAAIATGVSDWKVMVRHILPNSLVPVVTYAPFGVVAYVLTLVSLDYLGFGLKPGTPSWGYLLQQGQEHVLLYPHLILIPSLALAATLFCVVMIGEAVREGFDPKVFSRLR